MSQVTFIIDDPFEMIFIDRNNLDVTQPKFNSVMSPKLQDILQKSLDELVTLFHWNSTSLCIADKVACSHLDFVSTPYYFQHHQMKRELEFKGKLIKIHVDKDAVILDRCLATLEFETLQIVGVQILALDHGMYTPLPYNCVYRQSIQ